MDKITSVSVLLRDREMIRGNDSPGGMQKLAVQAANASELGIVQRPTICPNVHTPNAPLQSVKLPPAE